MTDTTRGETSKAEELNLAHPSETFPATHPSPSSDSGSQNAGGTGRPSTSTSTGTSSGAVPADERGPGDAGAGGTISEPDPQPTDPNYTPGGPDHTPADPAGPETTIPTLPPTDPNYLPTGPDHTPAEPASEPDPEPGPGEADGTSHVRESLEGSVTEFPTSPFEDDAANVDRTTPGLQNAKIETGMDAQPVTLNEPMSQTPITQEHERSEDAGAESGSSDHRPAHAAHAASAAPSANTDSALPQPDAIRGVTPPAFANPFDQRERPEPEPDRPLNLSLNPSYMGNEIPPQDQRQPAQSAADSTHYTQPQARAYEHTYGQQPPSVMGPGTAGAASAAGMTGAERTAGAGGGAGAGTPGAGMGADAPGIDPGIPGNPGLYAAPSAGAYGTHNAQDPYGNNAYGAPPAAAAAHAAPRAAETSEKSRLAGGLLGIFLGSLGVHNFYLGFTTKAVIQLLLTLVGWVAFGLGPAIAAVWGLIEGIMILASKPGGKWHRDAKGRELSD